MSKHSKNNCAHPVFSHAERRKLKWGTQKVRVGSDSIKPYDHCILCLHQAAEPVICPKGHLYCKSCIYEHLLTQKSYIKQQMIAWQEQEKKINGKEATEQEKVRVAEIAKFDESQSSINTKAVATVTKNIPKGYTPVTTASGATAYVTDRELNHRLGAPNATQQERTERKTFLPCFWIPSMTPDAGEKKVAKPSEHTVCPDGQHTLRLKQLRPVRFTAAERTPSSSTTLSTPSKSTPALSSTASTSVITHMCISCRKTLNNTVKCAVLTNCGHVACHTCVDSFVMKDGNCSDCGMECTSHDIVPLQTGTGFAASAGQIVKASINPGFVC